MMKPSLSSVGENQNWVQTTAKPQILRGEDGQRCTLVTAPLPATMGGGAQAHRSGWVCRESLP